MHRLRGLRGFRGGCFTCLLDVAWDFAPSRKQLLPAHIVFPDRTLIDRARPRSEAPLAEGNGAGTAELGHSAGAFLAAIDADETARAKPAQGAP